MVSSFSDRFVGSPDSFFVLTIHKKIASFNKKVVIVFFNELIYDFGATQSISEHRKNNKAVYSATLLN